MRAVVSLGPWGREVGGWEPAAGEGAVLTEGGGGGGTGVEPRIPTGRVSKEQGASQVLLLVGAYLEPEVSPRAGRMPGNWPRAVPWGAGWSRNPGGRCSLGGPVTRDGPAFLQWPFCGVRLRAGLMEVPWAMSREFWLLGLPMPLICV